MDTITPNDILDALRDAMTKAPDSGGGFTVAELQPALGCSKEKARATMAALIRAGEVEIVQVRRQRYDGVWVTQKGFRRRESSPRT